MEALILANGKGTHLRPLTVYTPKPIIPIVNTPLLKYQIEILRRAGARQITLFLDYQPGKIEHLFGNESELGVELRYVVEPQPLGTAGAYKFASKYSSDTTIVLNGDILTDLVIANLLKKHQSAGAQFTIATTPIKPKSKYGILRTDNENVVSDYVSNPAADDFSENGFDLMNAGIYIIEPGIAYLISEKHPLSFKYDVFPAMLERKDKIHAFPIEKDYWCAIDSLENYRKVHRDFLSGKIRKFRVENDNGYERATSAFIDEESVIGKGCVIKSNAKIIKSVLGKGVQVEEGAVVENSILWAHTRVSNSARIQDAVIASSCYVGKNAAVSEGAVLGDKSSLTDYTSV